MKPVLLTGYKPQLTPNLRIQISVYWSVHSYHVRLNIWQTRVIKTLDTIFFWSTETSPWDVAPADWTGLSLSFDFSDLNPRNVDWIFHKMFAGSWDKFFIKRWQDPETNGLKRLLAVKKSLSEFEQRVEHVRKVNFLFVFCLFTSSLYFVFVFCLCTLALYFVFCLFEQWRKSLEVWAADRTCEKGQQGSQTFKLKNFGGQSWGVCIFDGGTISGGAASARRGQRPDGPLSDQVHMWKATSNCRKNCCWNFQS